MNLWDAFLQIGAPNLGNNVDAKSAQLVVQGEAPLTPQQLQETVAMFGKHMQRLRASLVGFFVSHWVLSDGSTVRITSNSGMHMLQVWPAGGSSSSTTSWGVFSIPADTTHTYGWVPPAVDGANGTMGTATNKTLAGTVLTLKKKDGKTVADKLARFKKVITNNDFFVSGATYSNMSAQNWQHREWLSPDRKTLATTYTGTIRVNGKDVGAPSMHVLWACVYKFDAGDGAKPHVFAVGVSFGFGTSGYFVKAMRAPLGSSDWSEVASLDIRTLDATATLDPATNDMVYWVKKVDANASLTTCSLWIQSDKLDTTGAGGWVGVTDIDMGSGAMVHTAATGEWTRFRRPAWPDDGSDNISFSYVEESSIGGVQQIAFEYVGDAKVFTELHYSGLLVRTQNFTRTTSGAYPDISMTEELSVTLTDTRKVSLVRDTFSTVVYSVDIANYTSDVRRSSVTTGPTGFTSTTWTGSTSNDIDITTHVGHLLHYGGRGNLFLVQDEAARSVTNESGSGTATSSTDAYPITGVTGSGTRFTNSVLNNALVLDAGAADAPAYAETASSRSTTYNGVGGSGSFSDTNPSETPQWGCAGMVRIVGGHPKYAASTEQNWMNARIVDDFVLVSVPKITSLDYPDPANFLTYCSDPKAVPAYKVDATLGVLKGIRLQ